MSVFAPPLTPVFGIRAFIFRTGAPAISFFNIGGHSSVLVPPLIPVFGIGAHGKRTVLLTVVYV